MLSYRPVFIMGAPRSGTTLLASMLSSREDIIALPEMHYFYKLLYEEIIFKRIDKAKVIKTLKNNPMFIDLDIVNDQKDISRLLGKTIKETFFNIITKYNEHHQRKDNPSIWVEHSLNCHKYYSMLVSVYPNCKFVHIVRDGRAVFSSTKKTDWGYKDVILGTKDWRNRVSECMMLGNIDKEKVLTVKYENVINDTTFILKKICEFLSIKYESSMLNSSGILPPSFANRDYDSNKSPHTKSLEKWKKHLKKYEIDYFTYYNSDLLQELGYINEQCKRPNIFCLIKIIVRLKGIVTENYTRNIFNHKLNKLLKSWQDNI